MTLVKAFVPSTLLTLIVTAIAGSGGSSGGYLNLQDTHIEGHMIYWSWPFFLMASAVTWTLARRLH